MTPAPCVLRFHAPIINLVRQPGQRSRTWPEPPPGQRHRPIYIRISKANTVSGRQRPSVISQIGSVGLSRSTHWRCLTNPAGVTTAARRTPPAHRSRLTAGRASLGQNRSARKTVLAVLRHQPETVTPDTFTQQRHTNQPRRKQSEKLKYPDPATQYFSILRESSFPRKRESSGRNRCYSSPSTTARTSRPATGGPGTTAAARRVLAQ